MLGLSFLLAIGIFFLLSAVPKSSKSYRKPLTGRPFISAGYVGHGILITSRHSYAQYSCEIDATGTA
jgi:hypothetical protein